MAPSGAWRHLGGWALFWMLAGLAKAVTYDGTHSSPASACLAIDDIFDDVLNGTASKSTLPIVRLGGGCSTLTQNHACTPIATSLVVEGKDDGSSVWDARFDVFHLSVEPGVNLTLRNLVLSQALVFTVGYANMQPALFHVRQGGHLALQNVTLQTLCNTCMFYWTQDAFVGQQLGEPSDTFTGQPLFISDMTIGAVSLRNVSLTCDPSLSPPSPVDVNVHTARMLTAFVAASNALTLPAEVQIMDNITLPVLTGPFNAEQPDPRVALITTNTAITAASAAAPDTASPLTYIDANYTALWFYVLPPAKLTLRGLVLTRLRSAVWATGVMTGALAGGLPCFMIQSSAASSATLLAPTRVFEDTTFVVPQYEVAQVSYWCKMLGVMAPELAATSDFLRSLVWASECDVLDETHLMLQRVRSTASQYTRVKLTSVAPAGVPFDPNMAPPIASAAYEHVQPPLFLVRNGGDWVDAIAPVLPQDTWTSPQPPLHGADAADSGAAATSASSTSAASSSSGAAGGTAAALPALLLLDGMVTLAPADLRVPGGGKRVVRRSAVISSMRQLCGADGTCTPGATLDLGNLLDAVRLDGPNVTVLFQGITLRNISTTLKVGMTSGGGSPLRSFFSFDRSAVQIIYDSVSVELAADDFGALYRFLVTADRFKVPGAVEIRSMNSSYISMASFNFSGVRGSNVDYRILVGAAASTAVPPQSNTPSGNNLSATSGASGGSAGSNTAVIVGACVGGAVAALLLAVVIGVCVMRRRAGRRTAGIEPGLSMAAANGTKTGPPQHDNSDDDAPRRRRPPSADGTAAAAGTACGGVGVKPCQLQLSCAGHRPGLMDEESALCTLTGTVSAVTSASDAGLPPPSLPGPHTGAVGGAGLSAAGAPGPMARRVFSLARSVPEEDPLGEPEGTAEGTLEEQASAASGSCQSAASSGGAGGAGRQLMGLPAGFCSGLAGLAGPADSSLGPAMLASPLVGAAAIAANGCLGSGSGGVAPQQHSAGAGTPSSSSSCRRMSRTLSSVRPHGAVLADSGFRMPNLRVRALRRSPSRPSRSTASITYAGTSGPLPAPAPAVLISSELARVAGLAAQPPPPRAVVTSGSSARLRSDRIQGLSSRPALAGGQRREMSQGAIVGGAELRASGLATAVTAPIGSPSTGATSEPQLHNCDPDSNSLGISNLITKVPEPASAVQRLISEMAAQGTDQLLILEPIGQGGYGTVYRGVWRNLDVAVKTVLFQDRANLAPGGSTPGPATSLTQGHVVRTAAAAEQNEEQGATAAPAASGCAGGGTHNWMLASQQANNNSGSLPSVNPSALGGAAAACGPLGVASQQRAVLEAAVSCSVAHPNVVATYHYDITPVRPSGVVCSGGLLVSDGALRGCAPGGAGAASDWKLYLVQEFCDGGSLATALDTRALHDPAGMPNLALTLCTLTDIARGMAHIHSRSIVHGDLNPTNILIRTITGSNSGIVPMWNRVGAGPAGGAGGSGSATPGGSISNAATLRNELGVTLVAKVADFGLCGLLAPGKRHISNAVRGTPFYTAPETVATGTLTKASDVYSFGVIAWEVYTGRPPFQHVPGQGFVRDDGFPRLPPHVPPTLANMTLGCLNPEPDARPTFEQILDRLVSLQSKLAVSLQQRLSRLVANNGAILGTGTMSPPLGMPLKTSPHGSLVVSPPVPAPVSVGPAPIGGGLVSGGSGVFSGSGLGDGSSTGMPDGTNGMPTLPPGAMAQLASGTVLYGGGGSAIMAPASSPVGPMGLPSGVAFANSMPDIQPLGASQLVPVAAVVRQ